MEVLHPRCAGLDVHRDSVVACARLVRPGGVERHVETFGTTTSELERLARWLDGHAITHVAMEATGVYWKPVWAVLAEMFEPVLANADRLPQPCTATAAGCNLPRISRSRATRRVDGTRSGSSASKATSFWKPWASPTEAHRFVKSIGDISRPTTSSCLTARNLAWW